jgi:hypothetical protein
VFRFNEPRFKQARQELGPHECQNCHGEHTGTKINVRANYCSSCHSELKLEKDPIDVPHSQLVADKRFDTCLGCHDFHGNHERSTQVKLSQAIPPQRIESYFAGAASPYGNALRAPPLKERANAAKK